MADGRTPVSAEAEALRALLPSLSPEQRAAAEVCLHALENKLAEAEEKAAKYQQADFVCRELFSAFAKLRDRYASAQQFISKISHDEILTGGWSEAAFYGMFSNIFDNLDNYLRRFTGENAGEQTGQDSSKRRSRNSKRRPVDMDTAFAEISRFRYGQTETVPAKAERKKLRAALDVLFKARHLTEEEYNDLVSRLEKMALPGEITAVSEKLNALMKRFEKLNSGTASFHPGTKHAIKEGREPETAEGHEPPDLSSYEWQGPCPELMAQAAAYLCDAKCAPEAFNSGNRETSNLFLLQGQRLAAAAPGWPLTDGSGYTVILPEGSSAVWPEIPEKVTCPHCGSEEAFLSPDSVWWTMREAVSGMYHSAKRALAVLTLNYECPSCHRAVSVTVSGNGMYEYFDTLTGEGKPVPGLKVSQGADAAAENKTPAAVADTVKPAASQERADNGCGPLIWVRSPADGGTLRAVSAGEERLDRFLIHGLMPRGFDIKKAELMMPWSGASMPLSKTVHLIQQAFDMLVPYNRIASRMGISNGTFHTQVRALGRLMKPFADDILQRIPGCDTVMSDESHYTIDEARRESGSSGQYFWAISPGPACEDRSVRVLFTAERTNETAMEILGGKDTHWKTLISDDLSAYTAVIKNTGRRHQLCMAHTRRHLLRGMAPKAVNAYPELVEKWGYRGFLAGLDREYAG